MQLLEKEFWGAKGRYSGVDIRATLIWNTLSDLDLHCLTPSGDDIYYGVKEAGGVYLILIKMLRIQSTTLLKILSFKKQKMATTL